MADLRVLMWWEESNHTNELTTAVVTVSIAILVILCYKKLKLSSAPSLPPGPRSLPIVGYLPFLSSNLHKQFTDMSLRYGPIFKFYVGSKLHIVINTIELAKVVVREQDETFANRELTIAASVITNGGQDITFSNGSYTNNLRKIFVHDVISSKNLIASSPFRRDEVRKTINYIYGKVGTPVRIKEIIFLTVTKVVTRMIWENTPDGEAKDSYLGDEFENLVSDINELLGKPNLSDIFPILSWFDVQGIERNTKKKCKKLHQVFTSIIEDRIKSNSMKLDDELVHQGRKDLLQILLELKDRNVIDLTQMKGLILDLMLGATHTTTTLIEWAMAEVIKNDTVMKRIHEELAQVVGVHNIVEESHLPKLVYLDATIKETFRLHPVGPLLIPRSPSRDCMVGGYAIPKGCTVFLNCWAIHRDPRLWDNPMEFKPERFLTFEGANKCELRGTNLNFIPFGSGRRMCPGVPLAEKMQMYILASVLHSFDWKLPNGEKHDLSEKFLNSLQKLKPLITIPSQRLPNTTLYM